VEDTYNPLADFFATLRSKVEADARVKEARAVWGDQDARYGIDEYGRAYLRGAPSTPIAPAAVSPLLLVGVAILAVTLAVFAFKR
jgi:hypothetical protein